MSMTNSARGATVAALAAVAVAAAATALADLRPVTAHVGRPIASVVPVTRTQLSCPAVANGTGVVTAVAPRARPGNGISAVAMRNTAAAARPLAGPGRLLSVTGSDRESVDLTAPGPDAPGAAAVRIAVPAKGPGTGAGVCTSPAAQAWFTPVDTAVGSATWLVLTNPTSATTVVNLRFLGPKGPISAVGQRGIAVAAGGTKRVDLAPFGRGVSAMGVGVVATQGLVLAVVQTTVTDSTGVSGTEWISPVPRPSTAAVVGPGPGGTGRRHLVVSNVSGSDALVQVQAIGPGGAFRPTALTTIRLRPYATVVKDVTKITGRDPVAWSLTSAVPIVAGATATVGRDFVAAAGSPSMSQPVVVPVPRGSSLVASFAARLRTGGVVTVQAFDAGGRSLSVDRISVGGDVRRWRSRTAGAAPTSHRPAYVVVQVPVDAGVYGDVTYTTNHGSATVPLVSARWTVTRQDAVYQPQVGAP
jgi:hypothetical protein